MASELLKPDEVVKGAEKKRLGDEQPDTVAEALDRQQMSKKLREGKLDPNVYRGQKNYATYHNLSEQALRRKRTQGNLG